MPQQVVHVLDGVAQWLEILGATALVLGFVIATVRFATQTRTLNFLSAFTPYRQALGRVVLIGLEILVAATIIKTITVDPSPTALGLLAIMVAIRTTLSWTMGLEVSGRWPWQKGPATTSAPTQPLAPGP